jgi:hypothetical protein
VNLPFIIGLASVVATMSIGGGVLQERSRWLPAVLWVVVLLVGGGAWGLLAGPGPLWGAVRLREHAPNAVLVGLPSLACLVALLVAHDKALSTRIALACGVGVVGAVVAPFVALWIACAVTGDCL